MYGWHATVWLSSNNYVRVLHGDVEVHSKRVGNAHSITNRDRRDRQQQSSIHQPNWEFKLFQYRHREIYTVWVQLR